MIQFNDIYTILGSMQVYDLLILSIYESSYPVINSDNYFFKLRV